MTTVLEELRNTINSYRHQDMPLQSIKDDLNVLLTEIEGSNMNGSQPVAFKEPVRLATTGNITLSGLQEVDGVMTDDGDRILVWRQTTPSENGVYLAHTGAWERSTDCLDAAAMRNMLVGTAYVGFVNFSIYFAEWGDPTTTDISIQPVFGPALSSTGAAGDVPANFELFANSFISIPGVDGRYPWRITHDGYEQTANIPEPADGDLDNGVVQNWYDASNGAAVFGRKAKTLNGNVVKQTSRLTPGGHTVVRQISAPTDADINAGEAFLWFDKTDGAAKLKIKAKQANGTVVAGEVPLT